MVGCYAALVTKVLGLCIDTFTVLQNTKETGILYIKRWLYIQDFSIFCISKQVYIYKYETTPAL